jgi:hypothetical protein
VFDINGDFGGTVDTLDIESFLEFASQFHGRYQMTTVLGRTSWIIKLLLMQMGSANTTFLEFLALANQGNVRTRRPILSGITTEFVDSLADKTLVGLDPRYALEMVSRVGADLTETDKIIRKQLNEVVISEIVGFSVMDPAAAKVLDIST